MEKTINYGNLAYPTEEIMVYGMYELEGKGLLIERSHCKSTSAVKPQLEIMHCAGSARLDTVCKPWVKNVVMSLN